MVYKREKHRRNFLKFSSNKCWAGYINIKQIILQDKHDFRDKGRHAIIKKHGHQMCIDLIREIQNAQRNKLM